MKTVKNTELYTLKIILRLDMKSEKKSIISSSLYPVSLFLTALWRYISRTIQSFIKTMNPGWPEGSGLSELTKVSATNPPPLLNLTGLKTNKQTNKTMNPLENGLCLTQLGIPKT